MEPATTTNLIVLKQLAGNDPVTLYPIQIMMEPHVDLIIAAWTALWFTTLTIVLYKLFREWRKRHS